MTRWFARVGLPLSQDEGVVIADWMRVVAPAPAASVTAVSSWQEAAGIVRAIDFDSAWWDDEEAERERLWTLASERWSESELLDALDAAARGLNSEVHAEASAAVAAAGMIDEGVVGEATGMALLAAHQRALAELAGADAGHRFALKYALFAAGRWPLGYHLARFVVF
jgi:hypothetical protein